MFLGFDEFLDLYVICRVQRSIAELDADAGLEKATNSCFAVNGNAIKNKKRSTYVERFLLCAG